MKYLSMLERLDEGELVRAEDDRWLEELEVVHISGLVVFYQGVCQGSGWCLKNCCSVCVHRPMGRRGVRRPETE